MKIIRSYLLREHLSPFFVTLGGLTAVLLIGNMVKFAELVVTKGVSPFDLLRLLIYLFPYMLSFTIPMACLIAMILAFGRLCTDYELIALRASGVAPQRLVLPLVTVGLVISLCLLVVNDRVVPHTKLAFRRQLKSLGLKQPTAYLEAGTFIKEFPPYVIFVYHIQDDVLNNIRIYEPMPNGSTRTIIADRGNFTRLPHRKGVMLSLQKGTIDEWDKQKPGTFYKVEFDTYNIALETDYQDPERIGRKLKEMSLKELQAERRELSTQSIDTLPIELEFHRKIADSFAPVIFVVFGLVLGLQRNRYERLATYVWALVLFIGYYLISVGMNAAALKGWCSAWLAMWTANIVGLISGVPLLVGKLRQ
jgi:lipopolysaccharide export system permease protein